MAPDDKDVPRVTVGVARLSGGASDGVDGHAPAALAADALARFKQQQLRCIVYGAPWDTSLTWADAQTDLPEIDESDHDRAVADALLQMYDEGLVYFFEIEDFGESYSRTPEESEKLSRERLLRVLDSGSQTVGAGVAAPFLGIRATEKGRELHFSLYPDDRNRMQSER